MSAGLTHGFRRGYVLTLGLVLGICDHVVVLEFGTVIAAGPPDRVRNDPAVLAAYLGTAKEAPQ